MVASVPQEALRERPGARDTAQTHVRTSTRRTLRGQGAGPRGSHPPACRPTWQGACTHSDPPQPQTTRIRAHRHTAAVAHARSATRKLPFSATHAQARGQAGQFPARRPPGKRRTLRARAAPSPRPLPAAPVGAGRAGGGSCDTAREAARGWAAPATSSSSFRSKPAEPGQGRAEGSEGAGGAGHGAMAHQTGIHGEGGWRAGRG